MLKLFVNKVNLEPIYGKPTFNGVHSNFEGFILPVYKFGMAYTLVYRCFHIFLGWTKFHTELTFFEKDIS